MRMRRGMIGAMAAVMTLSLAAGAVFGLPTKTQTASAARSSSWKNIGEIYNSDGTFSLTNLSQLYQAISGGTTFATVQNVAGSPQASDSFRNRNSGNNISVTFNGIKWDAVYLTKDRSGNVILDLWQSADTVTVKSQFQTFDVYTGVHIHNVLFPSNEYSISLVRTQTLNAGGTRATGEKKESSVSQSSSNAYARFTMSGVDKSVVQYIVRPADVAYQETESARTIMGEGYTNNNEAYGTPTDAKWHTDSGNEINYAKGGDRAKKYYSDWKNDYLWLPSLTETGYGSKGGLWATDTSLKSSTTGASWLRTADYQANWVYVLKDDGNSQNNKKPSETCSVRPALHLNLTKVNANVKVSVTNSVTNLTFSGAAETKASTNYTATLTPATGYNLPSAITVKAGGSVLSSGSQYSYDANTGAITIYSASITGAIEIQASGVPKTSTVTFEKESGSGGSDSVTATYKSSMQSITPPTRTGYTFQGYYTERGGGGTQYYNAAGAPQRNCDFYNNLTLYAHWTAHTYTIKFEGNKPSTASGTVQGNVAAVLRTYDDGAKALPRNTFTLTGWTFQGWATSTGGGVVHADQKAVQNLTDSDGATVTLYAVWKANTYTVHYDSNKPTRASSEVVGETGDSSHTYDTARTLTSNGYSLKGWTFQGWATSAGSSDVVHGNSVSVENLTAADNGTVTLYAVWKQNTYTITFEGNKPANASEEMQGSVSAVSRAYDEGKNALPQNNFTLHGWTFLGWTTIKGSGATYSNMEEVENLTADPNGSVTLYAVWKANTHTITLNATGGSNAGSLGADFDSELPSITLPTRYGYNFRGYFDSATDGTQYYDTTGKAFSGKTLTIDDDVLLYAHWEAITYSIVLYSEGQYIDEIKDVKFGELNLPSAEKCSLTRKNFDFVGWNVYDEQNWAMYRADTPYAIGLTGTQGGEVVLYAAWQEKPIHSLFYDANGGASAPATTQAHEGETITLSGDVPSRENYTFVGWAEIADATTAKYHSGDEFTMGDSVVTLFAVWKQNPSLTYNANEGEFINPVAPVYPAVGSTVTLTEVKPVRTGYQFLGWAETADAAEKKYESGYNGFVMPEKDTVLYAVWEAKGFAVSQYAADGYSISGLAGGYSYGETLTFTVSGPSVPKVYINGTLVSPDGGKYTFTVTEDISVVVADPSSRVLLYSANGGEDAPTDGRTYSTGGSATVSNLAPTRTGYQFLGWSKSKEAQSAEYHEGGSLTFSDEDVVLYAVWQANTYKVTYRADGCEGEMSQSNFTYGTGGNLAENAFEKTGYLFVGWALSEGGECVFADGAEVLNLSSENGDEVTLYAVWEPLKISITFNAEGGGGGSANLSVGYGEKLPTSGLMAPVRSGYTFGGYFTETAGGGTQLFNENMLPVGEIDWAETKQDLTLYAFWIPTPETIQDTIEEVQTDLNDAIEQLRKLIETNQTDIANLQADLAQAISDLTDAYKAADAVLRSDFAAADKELEDKIDALRQAMENADEKLQGMIEQVGKDLETAVADLQSAIDANKASIGENKTDIAALQQAVSDLTKAYQEADALINNEITALKAQDSAFTARLDALESAYQDADKKLQAAIEDVQNNLDNAVANLNAVIEENQTNIEKALREAVTDLTNAYTAADAVLRSEFTAADEALGDRIDALERAMEEADAGLQAAIDGVEKALENAVAALNEAIAENKRLIEANKDSIDANKDSIDANKNSIEANKQLIEANKAELDAKVSALTDACQAADELLRLDMTNADEALGKRIDALERAMKEADEKLQAAIEDVQNNLNKAVADLQSAINTNKTDIEDKVSALDAAYQAADALINSDIAALKAKDRALSQSIAALDFAYKMADSALQVAIETVQDNLDRAVAELKEAIDTNKADIEDKVAALDLVYRAADALLRADMTAADEALANSIAALERAMNVADSVLQSAIDKVQGNLDRAVAELRAAIEANKADIEAKVTNLDAAYKAADALLRSDMAAADEALGKRIDALEKAMNAADSALQTAIEEVQTNLDNAVAELQAAINANKAGIAANTAAIEANKADIDAKVSALDSAYKLADALINSDIAGLKAQESALAQSIAALDSAYKAADDALWEGIGQVQEKYDALEQESERTALINMIINIVLGCIATGLIVTLVVLTVKRKNSQQ